MITFIGDLAESVPTLPKGAKNIDVHELFLENPTLLGVVIVEDSIPISLLSKTQFYQKIGTRYGYHLYMNRTIDLIIHSVPLIVNYSESIMKVSKLAMSRNEEDVYNYVIVVKNKLFFGIVSIQKLLLKVADLQSEMATFLNPLTKLPGNQKIESMLKQTLEQECFTVLYIDLDNFKGYNDTYGFKMGDGIIHQTSRIIKKFINEEDGFVGHIGGDDFIVILNHYRFEFICQQIIDEFDNIIKTFYRDEDVIRQFVITENRKGNIERIPLVSISIAVITNQFGSYQTADEIVNEATKIKKICKKNSDSCFVVNNSICC